MSNADIFMIYQLKRGSELWDYQFVPLDRLRSAGLTVEKENYNFIYTAPLESNATLDSIFCHFNLNHPIDFAGHSLSVSDVIVLRRNGKTAAYYVDAVGFVEVPDFLSTPYKYYSTQRPVDVGSLPKKPQGSLKIVNFDSREWVENSTFRAWGYISYDEPLTQVQMNDFELRAASDNPDHVRISPYQLEAQAQVVGKWEKSEGMPEAKRFTWWHRDFGVFAVKEFVTPERLAERFKQATDAKDGSTAGAV